MRASALSDDQVIRTINEFFVPVEINVTVDGFPNQLPAMKIVEAIFKSNWRNEFGFASCLALDPEGKIILGTSVRVNDMQERLDPEIFFSPRRYIEFMVISLERYKKVQSIQQMPLLQKLNGWKELLLDIGGDIQKQVQIMAKFQASMQ